MLPLAVDGGRSLFHERHKETAPTAQDFSSATHLGWTEATTWPHYEACVPWISLKRGLEGLSLGPLRGKLKSLQGFRGGGQPHRGGAEVQVRGHGPTLGPIGVPVLVFDLSRPDSLRADKVCISILDALSNPQGDP